MLTLNFCQTKKKYRKKWLLSSRHVLVILQINDFIELHNGLDGPNHIIVNHVFGLCFVVALPLLRDMTRCLDTTHDLVSSNQKINGRREKNQLCWLVRITSTFLDYLIFDWERRLMSVSCDKWFDTRAVWRATLSWDSKNTRFFGGFDLKWINLDELKMKKKTDFSFFVCFKNSVCKTSTAVHVWSRFSDLRPFQLVGSTTSPVW